MLARKSISSAMRLKTAGLVYLLGDTLEMGRVVVISLAAEAECCQSRQG
jgi:hypothetical protein